LSHYKNTYLVFFHHYFFKLLVTKSSLNVSPSRMNNETNTAGGLPALTVSRLETENIENAKKSARGVSSLSSLSGSYPLIVLVTVAVAIYAFRVLYKAKFFGDLEVSGNTVLAKSLFVDWVTGRVGIGAPSTSDLFYVAGTAKFDGNVTIGSTVFSPIIPPASLVKPNGKMKKSSEDPTLSISGNVIITGNLSANIIQFVSADAVEYYSIGGIIVLDSTSLGNGILYSSLVRLGTLEYLDITNNLTVGTADFVVNTDTGRVGVNTSSPTETLDVNGTLKVSDKIITDLIESRTGTLTIGGDDYTNVINIGVSNTHSQVVNIGSDTGFVNIRGNIFSSQAINLEVKDKNITLNDGGLPGSAADSGLEVEEGDIITAFFKINSERDQWIIKAPENEEAIVLTSNGPHFVSNDDSIYYTQGNVGIGITEPTARLHLNGDLRLEETNKIMFHNSNVLTIDTLGPSVKNSSLEHVGSLADLSVVGDIRADSNIFNTGMVPGNGVPVALNQEGKIVKVASSLRYKTNVRGLSTVQSSEEVIHKLNPVAFEYKNVPGETVYGLIAEEVADVDSHLVSFDSEGRVDGIQYMQLIPMLIQEIKKIPMLQKEINDLRAALGK
jgi:hypothetical protein